MQILAETSEALNSQTSLEKLDIFIYQFSTNSWVWCVCPIIYVFLNMAVQFFLIFIRGLTRVILVYVIFPGAPAI